MILVLHPSDELYGADRVLIETIVALRRRDEVAVWLPLDVEYPAAALSSALAALGVPVEHVDLPVLRRDYASPGGLAAVARRAARFAARLRQVDPDLLYVNTSALAPAVPLARALGIGTTLHVHETWGTFERRVLGPMAHFADEVVVVSEACRLGLSPGLRRRAVVRRHTVVADRVSAETVDRIRAGKRRPLVLFASRWTPGKGIAELLEAVALQPAVDLIVLGGPPPSGTGIDVPGIAASLEIKERVHIVGEVADVWPYLYACDAVAVPSVASDSYPTIALEAAAAGTPVLASAIGGLPEIVEPDTGELLPPGDVHRWSAALGGIAVRR